MFVLVEPGAECRDEEKGIPGGFCGDDLVMMWGLWGWVLGINECNNETKTTEECVGGCGGGDRGASGWK